MNKILIKAYAASRFIDLLKNEIDLTVDQIEEYKDVLNGFNMSGKLTEESKETLFSMGLPPELMNIDQQQQTYRNLREKLDILFEYNDLLHTLKAHFDESIFKPDYPPF